MLTEEILMRQNKALREENDELRETVRRLAILTTSAANDVPLPDGVGHLTGRERTTLLAILRRGQISREALFFAIYGDNTDVDNKLVDVWIHKLRRKLVNTDIRIVTEWGVGFRIERGEMVHKALTTQANTGVSSNQERQAA